jgi:hypothetical protein
MVGAFAFAQHSVVWLLCFVLCFVLCFCEQLTPKRDIAQKFLATWGKITW